jgi:3-oxoacyl-(acyl-carrier-protein) synthase III
VGRYLPERRVTNFDLAGMFDTSDEWTQWRTGIVERRFAEEGVFCSDLALGASREALKNAGMKAEELDFIILATLSPDNHFPGTGCYLQAKMGLSGIGAMDVRNQCSGFLYSLAVAEAFIRIGMYKRILVVGAEVHSSALNFTDAGRDVAVLFGDGAGAVIVGPSEHSLAKAGQRFASRACGCVHTRIRLAPQMRGTSYLTHHQVPAFSSVAVASGTEKPKVLPLPFSLVTQICPSWASTRALLRARPIPSPPARLLPVGRRR